jgi:adenine/guanine phosphoribosyltransferase-like PRPP-binding protein
MGKHQGYIDAVPSYMRAAFDNLGPLVRGARDDLEGVDFDTIVSTGLSGALVVPYLARRLGKDFAIVRKPQDGTHDYRSIAGRLGKRWLFVDDFISTGKTRKRVQKIVEAYIAEWNQGYQLTGEDQFTTTFVGTYEYNSGTFESWEI